MCHHTQPQLHFLIADLGHQGYKNEYQIILALTPNQLPVVLRDTEIPLLAYILHAIVQGKVPGEQRGGGEMLMAGYRYGWEFCPRLIPSSNEGNFMEQGIVFCAPV
jgi:hypothetical protein